MMRTQIKTSKYACRNGIHIFSNGSYVKVTNGNHVEFYHKESVSSFINFYNINENSASLGNSDNINNKNEKFVLHIGDVCELKIKNIIRTSGTSSFAFNLRNTGNVSLKFNSGNSSSLEDRVTQVIMENDVPIGCVFMYMGSGGVGGSIEFDVEFYVNGQRWI